MQLHIATKKDWPRIKKLYRTAFPKGERKPSRFLWRKGKQGMMELLVFTEDDVFLGFAVSSFHKDLVLLNYFAMSSEVRGQGFGSHALALLQERYQGKRLYLEIEALEKDAPNYAVRVRRKDFYLRNHFQDTGLRVRLFGILMEVLGNEGCKVSFDEYIELYRVTLGGLLTNFIEEANPAQPTEV